MAKRARGRDPFVQSEAMGPAAVLSQESAPLFFDYGQLPVEQREVVRRAARMIKPLLRRTAEDIFVIGGELRAVKAMLPHGRYTEWLEVEVGLSDRMAQHFVNVRERLGAKSEKFSVLPPSTLYMLAAPSTPDEAITSVEERLDAGERLTVAAVKHEISDLRVQVKTVIADTSVEDTSPIDPEDVRAQWVRTKRLDLAELEEVLNAMLRLLTPNIIRKYDRLIRDDELRRVKVDLSLARSLVNKERAKSRPNRSSRP